MKYIIKIDNKYLVGFEGETVGKTSSNGWNQIYNDMGAIELVDTKDKAYIFDGRINMKSALDKIYERMRYTDLNFDRLEVIKK